MQQKRAELNAAVVKLADAPDSKSGGLILRVGSSPTSGTKQKGASAPFLFIRKILMEKKRTRTEGSGEALRSKAEQRPTSGTKCVCL